MPRLLRRRLRAITHRISRNELLRLGLVLAVVLLIGAALLRRAEGLAWGDALWWAIVTTTSVGYGDIFPTSTAGRVVGVFVMLAGLGMIGTLTGLVASWFVERKLNRERGMGSYRFTGHDILCHWNEHARSLLAEIRSDPRAKERPIVVIADRETHPVPDEPDVHFIRGQVSAATLKRANLDGANTIVLLADDSLEDSSARDARNVLAALVIERLNPDVHSVVELYDEDNVEHCEHAHVDEIIVASEFHTRLISRAMLDHGVSRMVSEILSPRYGNQLTRIPVQGALLGRRFLEVFEERKRRYNETVLGVQEGAGGHVVANPAPDRALQVGDFLVVITTAAHE